MCNNKRLYANAHTRINALEKKREREGGGQTYSKLFYKLRRNVCSEDPVHMLAVFIVSVGAFFQQWLKW